MAINNGNPTAGWFVRGNVGSQWTEPVTWMSQYCCSVFLIFSGSFKLWGQWSRQTHKSYRFVCQLSQFSVCLCCISVQVLLPSIWRSLASVAKGSGTTHMSSFCSPLAIRITSELWVALWIYGEWITTANASGAGEAKSCLVAAHQWESGWVPSPYQWGGWGRCWGVSWEPSSRGLSVCF